jgi:hypothetical protein
VPSAYRILCNIALQGSNRRTGPNTPPAGELVSPLVSRFGWNRKQKQNTRQDGFLKCLQGEAKSWESPSSSLDKKDKMGRHEQETALLVSCRDRQWGDALRLVKQSVRPAFGGDWFRNALVVFEPGGIGCSREMRASRTIEAAYRCISLWPTTTQLLSVRVWPNPNPGISSQPGQGDTGTCFILIRSGCVRRRPPHIAATLSRGACGTAVPTCVRCCVSVWHSDTGPPETLCSRLPGCHTVRIRP